RSRCARVPWVRVYERRASRSALPRASFARLRPVGPARLPLGARLLQEASIDLVELRQPLVEARGVDDLRPLAEPKALHGWESRIIDRGGALSAASAIQGAPDERELRGFEQRGDRAHARDFLTAARRALPAA